MEIDPNIILNIWHFFVNVQWFAILDFGYIIIIIIILIKSMVTHCQYMHWWPLMSHICLLVKISKNISMIRFWMKWFCYDLNIWMKSDKDLRNTIKFLLFLQRRESAAQNCTAMINIFNFLHLFMFLVFCRYENKKYFAHENMKICQNSVHLSELLTCALAFQGKVSCMIWLKLSLRIISVHYPHHHP